jgi:hypothetical protein
MLLNKLASEDSFHRQYRKVASVSPAIEAVFKRGTTEARLRASIELRTDETNSDIVRASKQRWVIESRNGAIARSNRPLAFGERSDNYFLWSRLERESESSDSAELPKWAHQALARFTTFCKGLKYYGASEFTNPASCPVSFEIQGVGGVHRPARLRGHARLLYSIYAASRAESTERYRQFIDTVGPDGLRLISDIKFREIPTSSSNLSVRVGGKIEIVKRRKLLIVPQFIIGKQKLSPNQLSEGTFKTLALLFHTITGESTALLIEEPEVCVHHGLLASVLELIKSYSQEKQIILSTHSDYVLDHVAPENVFRVTLDKIKGTQARSIPKTMPAKELAALRLYLEREGNLGEFWREGGLGDRP